MKNFKYALGVLAATLGVVVVSAIGATSAGTQVYDVSAMASWVQAIGSIAAIAAAIWIARAQTRDLIKREEQGEIAELSACLYLFDALYQPFFRIVEYGKRDISQAESATSQREMHAFTKAYASIQDYPLHTIKTPVAVKVLFEARGIFTLNLGVLSMISQTAWPQEKIQETGIAIKVLEKLRDDLVATIEAKS